MIGDRPVSDTGWDSEVACYPFVMCYAGIGVAELA